MSAPLGLAVRLANACLLAAILLTTIRIGIDTNRPFVGLFEQLK
jgi:hypothetical protein